MVDDKIPIFGIGDKSIDSNLNTLNQNLQNSSFIRDAASKITQLKIERVNRPIGSFGNLGTSKDDALHEEESFTVDDFA